MEIILKQDVKGLGFKNDIVTVKPGYGRNFLLPKGAAIVANESNRKVLAETVKQQAFKEEKLRNEAQANLDKLGALQLTVGAKAGESGKIFGSVSNIQVAEALTKAGFNIERKNIEVEDIKALGTYSAKVRLFKDIATTISFEVVAG